MLTVLAALEEPEPVKEVRYNFLEELTTELRVAEK